MSPQEQRIAIGQWHLGKTRHDRTSKKFPGLEWIWDCPDYPNSLEAMHQAEEFLASKYSNLCWAYSDKLRWRINSCGVIGDFRLLHATASERAECLLRTLGKWKDDKTGEQDSGWNGGYP